MAENIQIDINANTSGLDRAKKSINSASYALNDLSRIAQDAPYGFIGISNNINPLVESFGRLKNETGSTSGALKAMLSSLTGPAGVGLAFGLLSAAISFASVGLSRWVQTSAKAKEAIDEQKKALDSIYSSEAKEATQVASMIAVLNNENETRNRKLEAIKKLQAINPEVFKGLKLENDTVVGLTAAYDAYIKNIEKSVRVKIIQQRLEEAYTQLIKLNGAALTESEKAISEGLANITKNRANDLKKLGDQGAAAAAQLMNVSESLSRKKQSQINSYTTTIKELTAKLSELSFGIDLPAFNEKKEKIISSVKDLASRMRQAMISGAEGPGGAEVDIQLPPWLNINTETIRKGLLKNIKGMNLPSILTDEMGLNTLTMEGLNKFWRGWLDYFKKGKDEAQKEQTQIITDLSSSMVTTLAEGIGNAIASGGATVGDAFKGIFSLFGDAIIEFGKKAVLFSKGFLVLKKVLEKGSAVLGIGAGIALIAIGAAIKATAGGGMKFATGTTNAPGGMSLVGERGPELVNLPRGSQVIPNGRTSAMLGGVGGSMEVYGVLRGQDIYFSNKKYAQTYNRTT